MSRLLDIRTIMAAALTTAGLKTFPSVQAVINPPCGVLRSVSGNWDTTLPRGFPMDKYELTVVLPASLSPEEAQRTLDDLLETAGKIKAAIENAPYAGKCSYARVVGYRNYGDVVLDQYIGVIFDIVTY